MNDFETEGVQIQVQKKTRKNHGNGMWSSEMDVTEIFGSKGAQMVDQESIWGQHGIGNQWLNNLLNKGSSKVLQKDQVEQEFTFSSPDDMEDEQITYLEPSPARGNIRQITQQGGQFYDQRFPPNDESIHGIGQRDNALVQLQIKWMKATQFMQNPKIFQNKIQPNDIKQGDVGDCYFMAGLAAIAEVPQRIVKLFLTQEITAAKSFSVKILYKGKWLTVDMDQYLPVTTVFNRLAFAQSTQNELWVILLQKAYAKIFKSYYRLNLGLPEEVMHDLTGAPIKQVFSKPGQAADQDWQYLVMASNKKYAMVASSNPTGNTHFQTNETGISSGHAYTFLMATTINFAGRAERVVKLRNPWGTLDYNSISKGKAQYCGQWCDTDPNWNHVSQSEKERVKYKNDSNDGTFFMPYDYFLKCFGRVTVCEINDNASYVYKSMKDKQCQGVYYRIEIAKPGYYSFHVDNTPDRTFGPIGTNTNPYRYPETRLELGKIVGNKCEMLPFKLNAQSRTLYVGHTLQPGTYVAYVMIKFDLRLQKDCDINLAVYSEYACKINSATREQAGIFRGNPNIQWNPAQHQSNQSWNDLANESYKHGDSGWGNQKASPQNGNNGWGDYFEKKQDNSWGTPQTNTWGGYYENDMKKKPVNDNWGQQKTVIKVQDNGWGQPATQPANNGWGQPANNGWGEPAKQPQQVNNGWGIQANVQTTNNGWGVPASQHTTDGWGEPAAKPATNGWGLPATQPTNNGWGVQQTNSGWGSQPVKTNHQSSNGWDTPSSTTNQTNTNSWGPGW